MPVLNQCKAFVNFFCYIESFFCIICDSVENQSDEVDGLGNVSVWSGGMDIKEIG